jgi:hypothetical protein
MLAWEAGIRKRACKFLILLRRIPRVQLDVLSVFKTILHIRITVIPSTVPDRKGPTNESRCGTFTPNRDQPAPTPRASPIDFTHSSHLLTRRKLFHVGPVLGDAVNSTDLSDLFKPGVVPKKP